MDWYEFITGKVFGNSTKNSLHLPLPYCWYRPVRHWNNPDYWKLSSFVARGNFSTRLHKFKIPPYKLNQTFMKAFRNFNCFSCFRDPENARMCAAGIPLFIRKNLNLFTFTKCQIYLNFLLGMYYFWLLLSPLVLCFSSEHSY